MIFCVREYTAKPFALFKHKNNSKFGEKKFGDTTGKEMKIILCFDFVVIE